MVFEFGIVNFPFQDIEVTYNVYPATSYRVYILQSMKEFKCLLQFQIQHTKCLLSFLLFP